MRPLRICGLLSGLSAGGAERVMSLLSNSWVQEGHAVTLVTLDRTENDFYRLDPRVQRVGLDLLRPSSSAWRGLRNNLHRVRVVRRQIAACRPDVVVSFITEMNVLTLVAGVGLRVPIVVSERVHPPCSDTPVHWAVLRRLLYRRSTRLVVQTERTKRWAESLMSPQKITKIPNPVVSPETQSDTPTRAPRTPLILAMGRLAEQKGFDVLVKAFAAIHGRHPDWQLVVLGEGELRPALQQMAGDLLPAGSVQFAGIVERPEEFLRRTSVFVLSSRYEGFPNALVEAMAHGCAVISTDCPTGPAEIVRHGIDGLLVQPEDVAGLAEAMDQLISNEAERQRLGSRAVEVTTRFGFQAAMAKWDALFEEIVPAS